VTDSRAPGAKVARLAGVDEAGRGPLAGPVVVAAVVLDTRPGKAIKGLDDSKRLGEKQREALFDQVRERALDYCIIEVQADEIDRLNILAATLEGMRRSVLGLSSLPDNVLVDGNRLPELPCPAQALVGGDGLEPAISAASILAKVHRDRLMLQYHDRWPGYGFDRHKGYPTTAHMAQLKALGPCPIHRRSFAPVRALI